MVNLLIVDDDAQLVGVLAASFRSHSSEFDVLTATSVEEAMNWLGVRSFDALLVDLFLPDGDGVELARRAKALVPRLNVVIMTGSPSQEGRESARREGVALFLEKPFDVEELRAALLALAETPSEE